MVSFAVQKLLVYVVPLVYIFVIASALGMISKKIITKTHVKEPFPTFSSRSFMVSGLYIKPLIHFKLIVMSGIK